MIDRATLIQLIQASRIAGRLDFASTLAADWVSRWPGDMDLQLTLARLEIDQMQIAKAIERLNTVVQADPELAGAYELLAEGLKSDGDPVRASIYRACSRALRGEVLDPEHSPSWAMPLSRSLKALKLGDNQLALASAQEALTADPDIPLPILTAVHAHAHMGDRSAAAALSRTGHDRWPGCIAFLLYLADDFLMNGDIDRGVQYMHQAASADPLAVVSKRILGDDHPYRTLWPASLSGILNQPVPAAVASVLGGNRIGGERKSHQDTTSEAVQRTSHESQREQHRVEETVSDAPPAQEPSSNQPDRQVETSDDQPVNPLNGELFRGPDPGHDGSIEDKLDGEIHTQVEADFLRIAERVNARQQSNDEDRRVPAYVVISSRTRLMQVYGEEVFNRIDTLILSLVEAARRHPGWTAYRLYLDDPLTLEPFGLLPADPSNAWQIKLRLADFDQVLSKRSEMIGALLIVGGDQIVPFHRLPNPVDDDDEIVFSDNPYATTDENYFAPEWPVGRLPSGDSQDLLLELLRRTVRDHRVATRSIGIWARIRLWFARRIELMLAAKPRALGFTASIWKKASLAVYKSIGEPRSLLSSPPTDAANLSSLTSRAPRLSYFNLHGLEDAPEWFGQRDPLIDQSPGPDFPIAFRPQDVVNSGNAPLIVFTEACYGANIQRKSIETALCLKFLSSGTRAVIGSTKISYGSVTTPLIAADLLGRHFWDQLKQRIPLGEALRRAKLKLAAEMLRRQGYLDGEDQKTLISFVLYGDPFYSPSLSINRLGQKLVVRRKSRPRAMKTVCALGYGENIDDKTESAEYERVKAVVAQYLPGMADAQCRIHPQPLYGCDGEDHTCPSHQIGIKRLVPGQGSTKVFTFSKHIHDGTHEHPHFARVTVDPEGKVLKLAVSR